MNPYGLDLANERMVELQGLATRSRGYDDDSRDRPRQKALRESTGRRNLLQMWKNLGHGIRFAPGH